MPQNRRMRFCMVSTYYPPYHFGGDAVFVQSLARALVRRGHHVEVVHCEDAFRLNGAPPANPDPGGDGVIVHRLRSALGPLSPLFTQQFSSPGLKRRPLEQILNRGFDVVNFHNLSLVGGLGALSMSSGAVTFYTLHEHWLICATHIFWKNNRESCRKAECFKCSLRSGKPPQLWRYGGMRASSLAHVDLLLSPSEYTARRHHEAGILAPIRALPTYSPLDPGPVTSGPGPVKPAFLFVGRITASKGIDDLVRLFARMPQFQLDVLGGGDLLSSLQKQYTGCPSIRFHGPVARPQLTRFYRDATALILPSKAPEVFPLTVLEAFACGTPAIVSDAGGSPEAVETSGAGFVFTNQEELCQAIVSLAEQPGLRERLSRLARAAFEQYYCEERYVSEYLDLATEFAERRDGARQ